jgi:hypothetical protein
VKRSKVKRLILKDIQGWRCCFDLDGWRIDVEYDHLDGKRVALCNATWRYMEATITFDVEYLAALHDCDGQVRADIRKTVVHELLHLVCSGYQEHHTAEQLERMVSTLTAIVDRCWRAPAPKGRKVA